MKTSELAVLAGVVVAAYAVYKFKRDKTQDITSSASYLPSGVLNKEISIFTPEKVIFRSEAKDNTITTYKLAIEDLSSTEQRAIRYGLYDIEDDKIQYGIGQGIERKIRDWWTKWTTK